LLAGQDFLALALVPRALLVGADVGRVANADIEAIADAEHGLGVKVGRASVAVVRIPLSDGG